MIDRDARSWLSEAIGAYASDTISAFTFDDRITEIASKTNDETVRLFVDDLWLCYDDVTDHRIDADKVVWDYLQRVQLALASEAVFQISKRWQWSLRQVIAILALSLFVVVASHYGYGAHLFFVAMPFGVVSILISEVCWKSRRTRMKNPELIPFNSYSDLIKARRRTPCFSKARYPKPLSERKIHPGAFYALMMLYSFIMWLMFSPVALLFQVLPKRDITAHLITPSAAATS